MEVTYIIHKYAGTDSDYIAHVHGKLAEHVAQIKNDGREGEYGITVLDIKE